MVLDILQADDPVLRQRARPLSVDEIIGDHIQNLIQAMVATMRDAPGVGLAAPQVGQSVQLIVIEDQERYIEKLTQDQIIERERKPVDLTILINPELIIDNEETVTFIEGCLSLPGLTAPVPRARSIRVKALNEKGEPVDIAANGWYARILQHEIDHLNGVLYIDRINGQSSSNRENVG